MTESALAALVTATIRTSMAAQTERADAIAAGVTYEPGPVLGELFSTTLTRNQHKLYLFQLVIVATKIGISPHISKNVRGLLLQGRKSLLCIVLDFTGFVELLFHRGVLVGKLANGEIFYLVVGKTEVVV